MVFIRYIYRTYLFSCLFNIFLHFKFFRNFFVVHIRRIYVRFMFTQKMNLYSVSFFFHDFHDDIYCTLVDILKIRHNAVCSSLCNKADMPVERSVEHRAKQEYLFAVLKY